MKSIVLAALTIFSISAFGQSASPSIQKQIYNARDKVMPAVVHIQPVIKNYTTGELEKQAVVGSGVIFHPEGYVVTNYHVAGKAERILCTLYDKEMVTAEFIGGDPPTDIAVVKLNLEEHKGPLVMAEFGNSDSIQVGQYVMAMGSPFALSRSVSAGVISTRDRYFSPDVRLPSGERTGNYNLWLQTDAAINPGNSGGPLVDLTGKVVGINSRATLFANNLGFAIPINVVREVTQAILTEGKVTRSWVGIHCQALVELEDYFGTERNNGVLVSSIDPGSPADQSFLKAGDIIMKVSGKAVSARYVEELPAFYYMISKYEPGSKLAMEVLRGNETFTVNMTTKALGELQGEDFEAKGWGFAVKAITRQMRIENQLDDTLGVFVTGVKRVGFSEDGGLVRGDVITAINNDPLNELAEFIAVYNQTMGEGQDKVLLTVRRGKGTRFMVITAEKTKGVSTNEEF
ncbi:MAG: trypsin-like peptidase domain-containing protein [Candidatus Zixiibacteriota bacterium]